MSPLPQTPSEKGLWGQGWRTSKAASQEDRAGVPGRPWGRGAGQAMGQGCRAGDRAGVPGRLLGRVRPLMTQGSHTPLSDRFAEFAKNKDSQLNKNFR